jgi:hypothetical protein
MFRNKIVCSKPFIMINMHDHNKMWKQCLVNRIRRNKNKANIPESRMFLTSAAVGEGFPPRWASRYAAISFIVETKEHLHIKMAAAVSVFAIWRVHVCD